VFENTFRAVNIALVNELTLLCDKMGISVWEVLDAAATKPFGIMSFYPGPGVGGHCIPLDPHYLEWKAREFNFSTRFIALAGEINRSMPKFVVEKASRVLNKQGKAFSRSRVLVLGAAYKKDIDDFRESPAIEIMKALEEEGVEVSYYDPHVPRFDVHGYAKESISWDPNELEKFDLVIIATDHSAVDYGLIVQRSRAVLDTRNATKNIQEGSEKVVLL
jgi:nucleotide sugar dehydrogenase